KLLDILGLDYLERIQQPFSSIDGLFSSIVDENGEVIATALGQDKKLNLNKISYQRKKNIRIKHQTAGTWMIASESIENVNKAAPLLDTMVQTVSEIANSYIMIYEEMENSRNANKLLGQNFEDQILVTNIYSMILQCTSSAAAFGDVISLIKEYFSLDEILFFDDRTHPVKLFQCGDNGEIIPLSSTVSISSYIDKELEYNAVLCMKEDEVIHNGAFRSCALSRVYENGKNRGILMFISGDTDKNWSNRDLKIIKSVTQILSTVIYRIFMENELAASREHLLRLAYFTPNTGIPNRSAFERDFAEALKNQQSGAVISVEISNFKKLSEIYNARYAEQILSSIAEYISAIPTAGNKTVYQFSNDILFVLVLYATKQSATALAQSILTKFRSPWFLNDTENKIDVFTGLTMFPEHVDNVQECVHAATRTLRLAKDRNVHDVVNYSIDLEEKLNDNLHIKQLISESAENDFSNFYFLYTPIVDAVTGTLVCCEAHLFWGDGDMIIPRDRFLPIIDRMGLSLEIYTFVLERICEFCSAVRECGLPKFFVTFSPPDNILAMDESVMAVRRALLEYSLPPDALSVYVSGSNGALANRNLKQLAALGMTIIADDADGNFFTDAPLENPDVKIIKLKCSRLSNDPVSEAFVKSLVERAHEKNILVCVNGVDNADDLRNASSFNADLVQGIINGRPLHTTEFIKKMVMNRPVR
ncbi:MAG: EAL domain-containing protein, partial [Oscillospiraceae bacterium]